jgi:hypothetical protein
MEDRVSRTAALVGAEGFLERYCEHLANGGDGPSYCMDRDVRYSDVLRWVVADEERKVCVGAAESAGAKWFVASIMAELKKVGMVDIGKAYDERGALLPMQDIPPEVRACIVAVESEELYDGVGAMRTMVGYTKRIKFSDKLKALELLGKNLQMFIDTSRVIHTGRVTLEDLVMASNSTQEVTGGEIKQIGDVGEKNE